MSEKKNTIFVEAASSYLILIHFQENKFINCQLIRPSRRQVNWLDYHWRNFLRQQNINQVNEIYLGQGPGSFTSLRISFSYIRTLSLVERIKTFTFSSIKFWRDFFYADAELFLQKANRNLYYGITKTNEIFAKTVNDWHIYTERQNITTTHVWPNAIQPEEELPFKFNTIKTDINENLRLDSNFILNLCQKHFTDEETALADLLPNYVHDLTYHKKAERNETK